MDGLQIKQVARETGLSEQVIRKWEQRYAAVTPQRLGNGYRVYSSRDVRKLLHIKQLVQQGLPVRQAVETVKEQVGPRGRETTAAGAADLIETPPQDTVAVWIQGLLDAGAQGNLHALDDLLQKAFVAHGLQVLVQQVVLPFLRWVGENWSSGTWSEDQEHLSTLTVRDFLTRRIADLPEVPRNAPTILLSCIPGERHDIMLQLVALEAKLLGWNTAFLGPSPAPSSIMRAIERLVPDVVLLSITTLEPLHTMADGLQWFSVLDRFAAQNPRPRYFLGGPPDVLETCTSALSHVQTVPSLTAFLKMLQKH